MWFETSVVQFVTDAIPEGGALLLLLLSYFGSVYVIGPSVILACALDRSAITWFSREATSSLCSPRR